MWYMTDNEKLKLFQDKADLYADEYCENIAKSYANWDNIRDRKLINLFLEDNSKYLIEKLELSKERDFYSGKEYTSKMNETLDKFIEILKDNILDYNF